MDHIPLVRSGAGAAGHRAGHAVGADALVIKLGLVAEVLESLGVALADHVGVRIVVEDIDQCPGSLILIGGAAVCGLGVVGHPAADLLLVVGELFKVVFVRRLADNTHGVGCCGRGRAGLSCVNRVLVAAGLSVFGFHLHLERKTRTAELNIDFIAIKSRTIAETGGIGNPA